MQWYGAEIIPFIRLAACELMMQVAVGIVVPFLSCWQHNETPLSEHVCLVKAWKKEFEVKTQKSPQQYTNYEQTIIRGLIVASNYKRFMSCQDQAMVEWRKQWKYRFGIQRVQTDNSCMLIYTNDFIICTKLSSTHQCSVFFIFKIAKTRDKWNFVIVKVIFACIAWLVW